MTSQTCIPRSDGPPTATRRWGLVGAGTALIGVCYGFARFAYGLFAPDFQATFGIGPTVSGVIGSGSYVGYCVAIVVSLVLTARVGPRRLAVAAGLVATVGTATVALAPSAPVLALGVLLAGSSTGLASPPLAAAVSHAIHGEVQNRAQTVVNAGTGLGVLVSGPIALAIDQWRWAWAAFALLAAAVTVWVSLAVPSTNRERDAGPVGRRRVDGDATLALAALLMGLSSVAVWTFGRDLVTTAGAGPWVSTSVWTVLGVAGVVGALGGDLVRRLGPARSWTSSMCALAVATAVLALEPGLPAVALSAAAVFGASYIVLTGLLLLWSLRLHPERPSSGVGLSFLMIAVGQAVGAPLVGVLIDTAGSTAFLACAGLGLLGAVIRADASPGRRRDRGR